MFTLGSFFTAFTLHTSNLEELSKKEDLSLEEILDEDNIIQEVKSAPQKFAKIMQQHPNLIKSMLDYIIKEPSAYETDQKKCFKYPFITSEIFGAEVKGFINMFFDMSPEDERNNYGKFDAMDVEDDKVEDHPYKNDDDEDEDGEEAPKDKEEWANGKGTAEEKPEEGSDNVQEANEEESKEEGETPKSKNNKKSDSNKSQNEVLGTKNIDYLFKFLETKETLNTTLAGYFQKAIYAFLNKRTEDFFAFLFNNQNHLDNFVRHVSTKSISDILIRIFMMDVSYSDSKQNETHYLNERKDMIEKLFEIFKNSSDHEEQENISNIITEIITRNNNCNAGKELIETIVGEKVLEILFNKILSNDSYPILYAGNILLSLVHHYQDKNADGSPAKRNGDEDVVVQSEFDYNILFSTLEKHLSSLIDVLQEESNIGEFSTSFGAKVKPFGYGKLKIVELINFCLKITNPPNMINILREKKIFSTLLKICVKYEWNNFLHSSVEKIIFTALDSENNDIKKALFEDINIVEETILHVVKEDFQVDSKVDKNLRRGYRAYFIKTLKYIQKLANTNSNLKSILDDSKTWKDFDENVLKKISEDENKDLGGHNPKKTNKPEEEVDNNKLELDIQKIYQRFSHYFSSSHQKEDDANEDIDPEQEIEEDFNKENLEDPSREKGYDDFNVEESANRHMQNYQEIIESTEREKALALQKGPELDIHKIEEEEISNEYCVNSFWKNELHLTHDVEELMENMNMN